MQSSLRVVLLQDGRGLNHELVRAGLAWMYRRYTNDHGVNDLEEEARVARRRLFPILVFLVQHSVHSVSQYTEREAFQKEIRHPQLSLMSGYSDDVVTRQACRTQGMPSS